MIATRSAAGAIPIVRHHPGLAALFEGEPVLVVRDWSELTPELLRSERVKSLPRRTTHGWMEHWVKEIAPKMLLWSIRPEQGD